MTPRTPRPKMPILAAWTLLAFGLLASCSRSGTGRAEGEGPWQRLDLWLEPPSRVESPSPGKGWNRRLEALGPRVIRDRFQGYGPLGGARIRVLRQVTGSRLAWELELGAEPVFTFVPVGVDPETLDRPLPRTHYRVSLRELERGTGGAGTGGPARELALVPAEPIRNPAPAVVRVDLGPWAHRRVELELAVTDDGRSPWEGRRPWAHWGSPTVQSRDAGRFLGAGGSEPRGAVPAEAAASSPGADGQATRTREGAPNVLLLTPDTLRADALGAWSDLPSGGPRNSGRTRNSAGSRSVTPALDRLAAESDVWLEAYSTFNSTNPSFSSIHTGLYVKHHGVYDLTTPLAAEHLTLAELFDAAGYDTLGVISAGHLGREEAGLRQGFDQVVAADGSRFAAELAVDLAMDWIAGRSERPFFAWVHFFDPHTPHTAPLPYAAGLAPTGAAGWGAVEAWSPFRAVGLLPYREPVFLGHPDLYGGEVAYLDRHLDRLLTFLDSRGLLETTVVAFTSDHGENLDDHGVYVGHAGLWDTTTHVPLMIRWPGGEGRRLEGLVQAVDLFPTLLEAAGLGVPPQDGRELSRLTEEGGRRAAFSEQSQKGGSVVARGWRYYRTPGGTFVPEGEYLYDRRTDPGETRNVADEHPQIRRRMAETLERWLADRDRPTEAAYGETQLTEEERERLRALGYLD